VTGLYIPANDARLGRQVAGDDWNQPWGMSILQHVINMRFKRLMRLIMRFSK